jgi:long-chain fatty acid transport protein
MMRELFRKYSALSLTILFSTCCGTEVFAAQIATSGVSARGIAMEGALTGLADDASAVYYNPAGLTQIHGTEFLVGNSFIFPTLTYTDLSGNQHQSDKSALGPYFYAATDALPYVTVALGAYAPFARDSSFTAGAGGFNARRAMIVRTDYTTTVSYQVLPQFSLGAGFTLSYGQMDGEVTRLPPVGLHVEEADGWGFGGVFGALYKMNDQIQFGIAYRTRETVAFDGHASQAGVKEDFSLDWRFPSTLAFGIAFKPTKAWTISANLDYVGWGHWDKLSRDFDTLPDINDAVEGEDIWEPRVGVEFKPWENFTFRTGYLYDSEVGPSRNLTPTTPDVTTHSFGFGVSSKIKDLKLNATYEYVFSETRSIGDSVQGLNGDYDVNSHVVSTSVSYRF